MQLISSRPSSLRRFPTYLAAQVGKARVRLLTDGLAGHDLRLAHYGVLAALDDLGPQCQRDLCDALDLDKSHMVGFVDDLEKLGLVHRERDTEDRRRYRVAISPDGAALLIQLHEIEEEAQALMMAPLTSEERQTLTDLLARVVDAADHRRLGPDDEELSS